MSLSSRDLHKLAGEALHQRLEASNITPAGFGKEIYRALGLSRTSAGSYLNHLVNGNFMAYSRGPVAERVTIVLRHLDVATKDPIAVLFTHAIEHFEYTHKRVDGAYLPSKYQPASLEQTLHDVPPHKKTQFKKAFEQLLNKMSLQEKVRAISSQNAKVIADLATLIEKYSY